MDRISGKVERSFQKLFSKRIFDRLLNSIGIVGADRAPGKQGPMEVKTQETSSEGAQLKVIKKGPAMRVIFFYPGEEGTYVDHSDVTLYENGIVHIVSNQEETTTHLQNCEILWRFETEAEERVNKVRLLKPKAAEPRASSSDDKGEAKAEHKGDHKADLKSGKASASKNPELVD